MWTHDVRRSFIAGILVGICTVATGCVTARPTTLDGMTAQNVPSSTPRPFSVSVSCARTGDIVYSPGPGTGADVSCENYGKALTAALQRAHPFATIVASGPADYALDVVLSRIDSPPGGSTTLEVALHTKWTLLRGGAPVWERIVSTTGSASFPGEFVTWPTGSTLATERAARANIEEGVRTLAATDDLERTLKLKQVIAAADRQGSVEPIETYLRDNPSAPDAAEARRDADQRAGAQRSRGPAPAMTQVSSSCVTLSGGEEVRDESQRDPLSGAAAIAGFAASVLKCTGTFLDTTSGKPRTITEKECPYGFIVNKSASGTFGEGGAMKFVRCVKKGE